VLLETSPEVGSAASSARKLRSVCSFLYAALPGGCKECTPTKWCLLAQDGDRSAAELLALLATLADDTGVWRLAEGGGKLEDATPDAPGAFARCGKCAS
jgi:hypothetical protein